VIGDEHNVSYKTPGYDVCLDTYGCQENEFPITRSSPRSEGSHTKARNEEKLAYQTEHPIRILRGEQGTVTIQNTDGAARNISRSAMALRSWVIC
jgi:hypothetical protein